MANNRMLAVCTTCRDIFSLAKFYPSTGWGGSGSGFDDWLLAHDHGRVRTWGSDMFSLRYEVQRGEGATEVTITAQTQTEHLGDFFTLRTAIRVDDGEIEVTQRLPGTLEGYEKGMARINTIAAALR